MSIRGYQPGDETSLRRLFGEVFQKEVSKEYWDWKYKQNPHYTKPWCFVYEHKGKIIGHVGLWVFDAYVCGEKSRIASRIDTMVSPEARGKGVYKQLNIAVFKAAEQEGIDYLFGFPASEARQGLLKHTPALHIGDVRKYRKLNHPVSLLSCFHPKLRHVSKVSKLGNRVFKQRKQRSPSYHFSIEEVFHCNSSFDVLAENQKTLSPIMVKRDSSFLNWRYFQHPDKRYRIFVIRKNSRLKGYVVVRESLVPYKNGIAKMGYLVDWLSEDNEETCTELFLLAKQKLSHCDLIQTWGNAANETSQKSLGKIGMKPKDSVPLLIHVLQEDVKKPEMADWWLTQGDTDSF
ncbi:GNAT family N-acetyltransferase [Halobacillus salinarum]|uniref:GNAT family N-acetyltransferase n=1 Tax=Halobacillus salinarum TaxID=2932257 RepID=A0ABY4EMK5_9BACI|nr:GNAT family N-acetyltransferase [Halobacillus salinarum]UOQ45685.1 GNAT family N-acetyltransferase [Halobacillus salinarum]